MNQVVSQMVDDLQELGVYCNEVLLVHASLRSLGNIPGGAESVIQSLRAALGNDGTLLFPGLSYQTVTTTNPGFDVLKTPSCVGALPEYFRLRPGTLRSLHPTHSVCGVGLQAQDLLDGHEKDSTPCGPNSPFHKLPQVNGQILFLGCGLRPNTSMHAIEELSKPPYLFSDVLDYEVVDENGRIFTMPVRRHNFNGWVQRYDRVVQVMSSGLIRGKVLAADCYLIEAADLWTAVHQKLQEEPLFFVDREEAHA